jgi:predicted amidohydrolase
MSRTLTIAAAQYPLDPVKTFGEYRAKIERWVDEALTEGAELLVFPEYGSMELSAIGNNGSDLYGSRKAVSDMIPAIVETHREIAKSKGVAIVCGSAPQERGERIFNVAHFFGPNGAVVPFAKIMPTPWERDVWKINGGRELTVFEIGPVKVGLLICYDVEFPLLSRALAEAGAEVILAPSDTELPHGYWRVRTGAAARALENQIYTVHAPLVGVSTFCIAGSNHTGAAGIFAPPDKGFPDNGVMALGEMNKPQWVVTKLELDRLAEVRTAGGVQTFNHWPEQMGAGVLPAAKRVDLLAAG